MKKILLLLIIPFSFILKGQNYIISMYDTIKYGNTGATLLPMAIFTNVSIAPVQMHMNRIVKNIPAGWTSCFCYPTCLAQTTNTFDFVIPIASGKIAATQTVAPNFGTDSIAGVGVIIVVFNEIGTTKYDTVRYRGITSKPTGIKETNSINNFELNVYPNPASNFLNLKYSLQKIGPLKFEIFSVTGQKLKETNSSSDLNQGENKSQINIEGFESGLYYLKLSSEKLSQTIKFTVIN